MLLFTLNRDLANEYFHLTKKCKQLQVGNLQFQFSKIFNRFDQNDCQGLKIVHVNVEKLFTNVRIKSLLGPFFTLNLLFVEVMEFKCQ